jgi:hypothetical protein
VPLPADLRQAVEQKLAEEPELSWDRALNRLLPNSPPLLRRPQ